ncbi:MAG: DUF2334 domain-containing protein [Fibrobacteria bacterium]|nr:DUF2334 domain-containing protein [Fibrobacteria bacterium]
MKKKILLSIHDIHNGNYQAIESFLQNLPEEVRPVTALAIVPRYHDTKPLPEQKEFCTWLKEQAGQGSELFIHGLHHLSWEQLSKRLKAKDIKPACGIRNHRNARGKFINKFVTENEAELCGLEEPGKMAIIKRAVSDFNDAGVPFKGFIAPTWYGTPLQHSALRKQGISILESRFSVSHLLRHKTVFAPPVSFPTPGSPLFHAARAVNNLYTLSVQNILPVSRIALHPADLSSFSVKHIPGYPDAICFKTYSEIFGIETRGN